MKHINIFIILFFSFNLINAQFAQNHAIYQTSEITLGNYLGVNINANYVLKESVSFKLGYAAFIRQSQGAPDNYSPGLVGLFTFGLFNPYDQLQNFQAMAGKVYKLNKKGTIRANLSMGVGFTIIREPANWEPVETNSFLGHNYSFEYGQKNAVSLIINPKIEFPFTRYYGLELSPMLIISKDRNYIGIGIGHMIGLLRGKYEPEEVE